MTGVNDSDQLRTDSAEFEKKSISYVQADCHHEDPARNSGSRGLGGPSSSVSEASESKTSLSTLRSLLKGIQKFAH